MMLNKLLTCSSLMILYCFATRKKIIFEILRQSSYVSKRFQALRVSFFKSEFIGIKVNEDRLQLLADLLGCKAGGIPNTYFSLPLCNGVASKSLWFPVLERLEKRLSLWKTYYLSFGGRITLIKAALANLPIYFISIFKCLVEVIKCMEKLQKDFLWQGNEKKMKFHLIKWAQVCKSEEYGGSGIRSLKEMNLAPDGKWLWRIGDVGQKANGNM